MLAYLLITVGSGKEKDIAEALKNYKEIKQAHILFGEWDIICLVEINSPEHLGTFVMEKIRTLPGVKLTSTMIVAQ